MIWITIMEARKVKQRKRRGDLEEMGIKEDVSPVLQQGDGSSQNPWEVKESSFHGIGAGGAGHPGHSDLNAPSPHGGILVVVRIQEPDVFFHVSPDLGHLEVPP